jgi:hypothetical protein
LTNTGGEIFFQSPDGYATVLVSNGTALLGGTDRSILCHSFNYDQRACNFPPPGFRLTQFDNATYFVSGYHAARTVGIQGYGGVGEPPTLPGTAPYDVKLMFYTVSSLIGVPHALLETHTLLDVLSHTYLVEYLARPEYFANYSSTAQRMIDSFQMIEGTGARLGRGNLL